MCWRKSVISKSEKQAILLNINSKDEKIKVSNIIDKYNKSDIASKITNTNFLDLNEKNIVTSILNKENINYKVFFANSYCEKCIIFFVPDYLDEDNIQYNDYVSCIKINVSNFKKLKHKDFMGSIYSLGIKNEFIGDIFLTDDACYVFVIKTVEKYILDNLLKVSNQNVECKSVALESKELDKLKIEYISKEYIIPSRRIDALLSEVYNLSRKKVKEKIISGDLFINAKECTNPSLEFYKDDIVSFKRCGKFKVGNELRQTKSGNICINVKRYR